MLVAMAGTHGADVCSITDEAVAVKWTVALASRTYSEDQMREREWRCTGCGWPRASSCSAAHRGHGSDDDTTMWPYQCSSSGASCSGGWSGSRWSYMRGGLGDGVAVVTCLASDDAVAEALRFALL